jgi:hypothetical protein
MLRRLDQAETETALVIAKLRTHLEQALLR